MTMTEQATTTGAHEIYSKLLTQIQELCWEAEQELAEMHTKDDGV